MAIMFAGMDKDYYDDESPDGAMQDLLATWNEVEKRQEKIFLHRTPTQESNAGCTAIPSAWGSTGAERLSEGGEGKGALQRKNSVASEGSTFERHHHYADHTMAYKQTADVYERAEEMDRKEAFEKKKKIIGKPFDASGKGDSSKPSRILLGDCVRELYHTIAKDWVDADPVILTTAEDLIVIYFHVDQTHHFDTLRRYMNGCLLRNITCRQYDLRKVPEGWCRQTEDGHVMFTLRPLWVPLRRFVHSTKLL